MAQLITNDNELTSLADHIRAKGGTTEPLAWPAGYEAAVDAIETGGGTDAEDGLIQGNLSGDYVNDRVTEIKEYGLLMQRDLTSVKFDNVLNVGGNAFNQCSGLTFADMPKVTNLEEFAFYGCDSLRNVNMPSLEGIGQYAFDCCILKEIVFPHIGAIGPYMTRFNTSLTKADLGSPDWFTFLDEHAFADTYVSTLILRTQKRPANLFNVNALENTPIAKGTGYIYVPKTMVDQYKADTNWTVYAAQFRAIEDYPEITGG